MTTYHPHRGGHAPTHLRGAFAEELVEFGTLDPDTIELSFAGHSDPVAYLIGQLWNCTDVMPRLLCEELDLPQGATYARGVRRWRSMQSWPQVGSR